MYTFALKNVPQILYTEVNSDILKIGR